MRESWTELGAGVCWLEAFAEAATISWSLLESSQHGQEEFPLPCKPSDESCWVKPHTWFQWDFCPTLGLYFGTTLFLTTWEVL